jgi:sirohydrochlorin ferrochelatase
MTDPRVREELVEAAAGAWRPRRPDGSLGPHPAWADLDEAGRREAFEAARVARAPQRARRLEAALDPEGLSSTARALMARVRSAR